MQYGPNPDAIYPNEAIKSVCFIKVPIQEIFTGTAHHKDYGEPVVITNNYVTFEARRCAKDLAVEIIAAPEWEEFKRINIEGRVDNPNQHT